MHAILMSDEDLAKFKLLVSQQGEAHKHLEAVLAHPLPNLTAYLSDLAEVINRARDGSSYIDEDFGDFLEAVEAARPAYANAIAARKAAA